MKLERGRSTPENHLSVKKGGVTVKEYGDLARIVNTPKKKYENRCGEGGHAH